MSDAGADRLQRPLRAAPPASRAAAWPTSSSPATCCSTGRSRSRCCSPSSPPTRPSSSGSAARRRPPPTSTTPTSSRVYDWGQEGGTYFIVMEYVDGRSLSEILRTEGPLHPRPGRRDRRRRRRRPRLRPPQRRRPPRRQARQRPHHADRPGEGGRLRHRPGHQRRRRATNLTQTGVGHGHRHLLLARAGPGQAGRPPQRPLLARRRAVRDGHAAGRRSAATARWPSPTSTCRSARRRCRSLNADVPAALEAITRKLLAKNPVEPLRVGRGPPRRPAPLPATASRCWPSPGLVAAASGLPPRERSPRRSRAAAAPGVDLTAEQDPHDPPHRLVHRHRSSWCCWSSAGLLFAVRQGARDLDRQRPRSTVPTVVNETAYSRRTADPPSTRASRSTSTGQDSDTVAVGTGLRPGPDGGSQADKGSTVSARRQLR